MKTGRVIPIRAVDGNGSKQPAAKMILTIGSRRFQMDADVRLSELPFTAGAAVIPMDRLPVKKGRA